MLRSQETPRGLGGRRRVREPRVGPAIDLPVFQRERAIVLLLHDIANGGRVRAEARVTDLPFVNHGVQRLIRRAVANTTVDVHCTVIGAVN